jgi:exosortase A-associated hydrolase 2
MPLPSEAFFLPARGGRTGDSDQRHCLFHPSQTAKTRGLLVYIHPFAEEMNKSRRMAALQARALAQAGYAVLQIDLLGCGDSAGDFGDATWQSWVDDVADACQWLRERSHTPGDAPAPLWLWGLRAGCLLAVDAARQMPEPCNFLFWQPPAAGKPLLQQFLRLKLAGDLLGGQSKGVMESLRQQLAEGVPVEIAGYMTAPALAAGLEQATLLPPPATPGQRVEWFELSTREDASLSPVSAKAVAQWNEAGYSVTSHMAQGPAFWQTAEIEDAPALITATTAAMTAR